MRQDFRLWGRLFLFRLFNALFITTACHPDEYWQFGEPAHRLVFGYGYWTWDWMARIRSFVFLLPLIGVFHLAKLAGRGGAVGGMLEDRMVQHGSKFVMAFWAATADLYTVKLAHKWFGPSLFFTLTNAYNFHTGVRSFSNNVESALSVVALHLWPMTRAEWSRRRFRWALLIIGIACLIRVTAVQFWIVASLYLLTYVSAWEVVFVSLPVKLFVLGVGTAVDSLCYGQLTFAWWNFFHWNVLKKLSSHYGIHPALFHITRTLPQFLLAAMPYCVFGVYRSRGQWSRLRPLVMFVLPTVLFNSLLPHKEPRFLTPILPLLLVYGAFGAQQLEVAVTKRPRWMQTCAQMALGVMVLLHSANALFHARFQFNGIVPAIDRLRWHIDHHTATDGHGVFFLGACHYFPYYGYLHRQVPMDFVRCHLPPVDHLFHHDPDHQNTIKNMFLYYTDARTTLVSELLQDGRRRPAYVVTRAAEYFNLKHAVYEQFERHGYRICERVNNSLIAWLQGQNPNRHDILILCRTQ